MSSSKRYINLLAKHWLSAKAKGYTWVWISLYTWNSMWWTQTGCNTISFFFPQLVVWSLLMPAQVQRLVFNAAKHIWQQLNTLAYHILFLSQMSHQSFFSHSILWRHRCSCQKYEATSKSWFAALGFIHINKDVLFVTWSALLLSYTRANIRQPPLQLGKAGGCLVIALNFFTFD